MNLSKYNAFNDQKLKCYRTVFHIEDENDIDDMWYFCTHYVSFTVLQANLITTTIHFLYNAKKSKKNKKSNSTIKIYFEFTDDFFYISIKDSGIIKFFKNNSELFNNIKYKTSEDSVSLKIPNLHEEIEDNVEQKIVKKSKVEKYIKKTSRKLSNKEELVLKKSRNNLQLSAEEYSKDIDDYVMHQLHELDDIEAEVKNMLEDFSDEKTISSLYEISDKMTKYSSTISQLIEFEDLSFAIKSLANVLLKTKESDINNYKQIHMYLSSILLDLSCWRRTIFIEQSANDIHYLSASLFSTILQFESIFNDKEKLEEEDFELF